MHTKYIPSLIIFINETGVKRGVLSALAESINYNLVRVERKRKQGVVLASA